ncbi:asparaginase [Psychrobacter sp. I-STPA6b]|uniref:asparaginase n=1 Tax=Psychrobacter sp. I-STPA6b TaxID=2585718 RepID=UPI001D0CD9F2|nr:asparaginase [Psychrobacter sp. I-STPA6b]
MSANTSILKNATNHSPSPIQLIYAGGTFGSYGKPLQALDAKTFIPLLRTQIQHHLATSVQVLANECVKDSSQLTPSDLVYFYQLILQAYQQKQRQFVLITGTDTLSYLSAFLAEAFAGSDICLILTASMRPLFAADNIHEYQLDPNSDAWQNLKDAIALANHGESGVKVTFSGEAWAAQSVQKVHSHDLMAFTGHQRVGYPASSYVQSLSANKRITWLEKHLALLNIKETAKQINIPVLYCVPNQTAWLATALEQTLTLAPTGIILIGFGAGNIPFDTQLAQVMEQAYNHGHMLVCTTQCPFGGVSDTYAAGSWQYDHHVISGQRLTIPAIYARLLWLNLTLDTPRQRRQRWTQIIKLA